MPVHGVDLRVKGGKNMQKNMQRFLRDVDVAEMLGIGQSTVWVWAREGKIPQPVKISRRCVRWRMSDLQEWEEKLCAAQ